MLFQLEDDSVDLGREFELAFLFVSRIDRCDRIATDLKRLQAMPEQGREESCQEPFKYLVPDTFLVESFD